MSKERYGYVATFFAGGLILVVLMGHLMTAPAPQGYQTMLVWGEIVRADGESEHYLNPAAVGFMVTQMSNGQVELDWVPGQREALLRSNDPNDKQAALDQLLSFAGVEQQNAIERINRRYERERADLLWEIQGLEDRLGLNVQHNNAAKERLVEAQSALRALDDLHTQTTVTPLRVKPQ